MITQKKAGLAVTILMIHLILQTSRSKLLREDQSDYEDHLIGLHITDFSGEVNDLNVNRTTSLHYFASYNNSAAFKVHFCVRYKFTLFSQSFSSSFYLRSFLFSA